MVGYVDNPLPDDRRDRWRMVKIVEVSFKEAGARHVPLYLVNRCSDSYQFFLDPQSVPMRLWSELVG